MAQHQGGRGPNAPSAVPRRVRRRLCVEQGIGPALRDLFHPRLQARLPGRGRRRHGSEPRPGGRVEQDLRGAHPGAVPGPAQLGGGERWERHHLVLRAGRLGPLVPVRRPGEPQEPDHLGPVDGGTDPPRRRAAAQDLFHGQGAGAGSGRLLCPPVRRRLRRVRPAAAHAGGCEPHHRLRARRQILHRHLLTREPAAGHGASRRRRSHPAPAGGSRHLPPARDPLEATRALPGEGPRRDHRARWDDVQAHGFRFYAEVPDHRPHLPGSADHHGAQELLPHERARPALCHDGPGAGAGGARLHRGAHRPPRRAVSLQGVP